MEPALYVAAGATFLTISAVCYLYIQRYRTTNIALNIASILSLIVGLILLVLPLFVERK